MQFVLKGIAALWRLNLHTGAPWNLIYPLKDLCADTRARTGVRYKSLQSYYCLDCIYFYVKSTIILDYWKAISGSFRYLINVKLRRLKIKRKSGIGARCRASDIDWPAVFNNTAELTPKERYQYCRYERRGSSDGKFVSSNNARDAI
ncbi:hypothetical protein PUN28_000640 [Cardiocondyla obscurior]|uniref:Uncharacterized protein n=1 Tax=Cardiocondyla obscurior TaxID=286306 RepID=A0AAW2H0D7_9HYME